MNKGRTTSFIFGALFGGAIMYHFVEKSIKELQTRRFNLSKTRFKKICKISETKPLRITMTKN